MIILSEYPTIDNDIALTAALRGADATDRLLALLASISSAILDAAKADPELVPALLDLANGMADATSDLRTALEARDAAIEAYENDCAGVEWAPEMEHGTQAGRKP